MKVAPARMSALAVLARVRKDGAFSGAVLSHELRARALSRDDAALTTRLVYGVLGAQGVLDEAIDRHLRGGAEPRIRDIMRLAAYELLYGRAPVYAVVDQAVATARSVRPQAAGLVNAVIRRVAEAAPDFPWGDASTDRDVLARVSACPRWIVDEYLAALGEETGRAALLASTEPAPSYIRLDTFAAPADVTRGLLADAGPVESEPDPDCLRLEHPSALHASAPTPGWFSMDAAAQFAPAACAPRADLGVLDVGAGRGNKTLCLQSIAMRTGRAARITALEVHEGKAERLSGRLAASGVPDVAVVTGDACEAGRYVGNGSFDVALLDAPCTGLGTLRRYPEKRWRLVPEDVSRMAALQQSMLEGVALTVRPGGRVVYSTCSIARAENAGVVDAFLHGSVGRDFSLEPLSGRVPGAWRAFLSAEESFQSWPTTDGPDGHFVAVLRRNEA